MREYPAVIEREGDGRYSVYVPDLPGCASMGDTRREALANVREAIACYVEGHFSGALKSIGSPLSGAAKRVRRRRSSLGV